MKKTVSKEMKGEHFDLTNDSRWLKNIKEIKTALLKIIELGKGSKISKGRVRNK